MGQHINYLQTSRKPVTQKRTTVQHSHWIWYTQ